MCPQDIGISIAVLYQLIQKNTFQVSKAINQ